MFSKRVSLLLLAPILAACACTPQKPTFEQPQVVIPSPVVQTSSAPSMASSVPSQTASAAASAAPAPTATLPPSVLIKVPFSSQAPTGNWDALHEEACEEMSLIMVHHFLAQQSLGVNDAESEVQALVAWERDHGYKDDVSIPQLQEITAAYYGLHGRVLTNVTADMLRKEIAAGHPVIIPAAGQTLGNPYFSGKGPPYHMLVVIGYTPTGFITNDPGTKRGEQYLYTTDVLINAIHDWNGSTATIEQGPKNALVVE